MSQLALAHPLILKEKKKKKKKNIQKIKNKKRKGNNDLADLPSHDIYGWSDRRYNQEYWGRLERNWR